MPNDGEAAVADVAKIGLKLPPFWDKHPELWFVNIEAQFVVAGITQDTTKYYSIISALNSEVLTYVCDIVLQPPAENKYNALKQRLIAEFSDSDQQRIKTLLSELVLGNDKPSQLLRRMGQLGGKTLDTEFLKTLWLQRLPIQTQTILSISEDNVEKLASMADKIHETTDINVAAVQGEKGSSFPELNELRTQISELSKQVERLSRSRAKHNAERRDSSQRRRSNSRHRNYDKCWYHFKFGDAARRCKSPCSFGNSGNEQ